jgi:hypothetical protein
MSPFLRVAAVVGLFGVLLLISGCDNNGANGGQAKPTPPPGKTEGPAGGSNGPRGATSSTPTK